MKIHLYIFHSNNKNTDVLADEMICRHVKKVTFEKNRHTIVDRLDRESYIVGDISKIEIEDD